MANDAAAAGKLRAMTHAAVDEDLPGLANCVAESAVAQNDSRPPPRRALLFGLIMVIVMAMLLCWLGFHVNQSQQAQNQRSQFLQVARQGALNLTTIDWRHADVDVRRILDSATGEFYNDFGRRSAAVHRSAATSQGHHGRHHHRGRAGVADRRPSPGLGRSVGADVE